MEPGFESPYRYHPSLALAKKPPRATDGRLILRHVSPRRAASAKRASDSQAPSEGWSTVARVSVSSESEGGRQLQVPLRRGQENASTTAVSVSSAIQISLAVFRRLRHGRRLANFDRMPKLYVYVLKNCDSKPRYYTGLTSDLARRLAEHNSNGPHRTCRYRPWSIDVVIEFTDERRAVAFERYLKSG